MEILYLYFKTYDLPFANQDINFGGKFRFRYDIQLRQLIVLQSPFYIGDFFSVDKTNEYARVLNVTSVIGENGTGKTSLLKAISQSLAQGHGGLRYQMIIVLSEAGSLKAYNTEELPIDNDLLEFSIQKIGLKSTLQKQKKLEFKIPPKLDAFRNTDFIYFSNVYDSSFENDVEVKGTRDISTNFLIRNDYVKNVENGRINRENSNPLDVHLFEEKERQIAFVNRYQHDRYIPFDLPDSIVVTPKRRLKFEFEYTDKDKKIIEEYGFLEQFKALSDKLDDILTNTKVHDKNIDKLNVDYLVACCLMNFLLELATSYRSIVSHVTFRLDLSELIKTDNIETITVFILKELKQQSISAKIQLDQNHYQWIDNTIKFVESIYQFKFLHHDRKLTGIGLHFQINNNSRLDFGRLYHSYRNSYRLKPYLNFSWRNLSSGENALLNIYSRFYALSNEEQIEELKENIIILIDEGDVYLHPSWQKKFVNILLNFLPKLFSKTRNRNTRNIQIILSTNSPIPASDLPNENTIFLERNELFTGIYGSIENRTIVKDSLNDQKETFAANIYTLLSDSFFIKDGLIGDFASLKINEIIADLTKGPKPSKKRREEIRNTIHQIGEPLIKHKLMQLYNDRFNLEIHERLDEIENRLGI